MEKPVCPHALLPRRPVPHPHLPGSDEASQMRAGDPASKRYADTRRPSLWMLLQATVHGRREPDSIFPLLSQRRNLPSRVKPAVCCFPQVPDNFRTNNTAVRKKISLATEVNSIAWSLQPPARVRGVSLTYGKSETDFSSPPQRPSRGKRLCATLIFQVKNERYLKTIVFPQTRRKITLQILTHIPLSPKRMPILYKMPLSP